MKKRTAAEAPLKTFAPFQKGQIWKIRDVNLAVTLVGKLLVHYKLYATRSKGIPATLTAKPELLKYLLSSKAVLVS